MTNQIRIRVKASGVNRVDLLQSLGKYDPPASGNMGLEAAGLTDDNQRVCVLVQDGAHAEDVYADPALVLPIPDAMTFEQAAAIPEALFTSIEGFMFRAHLRPHDRVLVVGALSGVGTIACQVARLMGAHVVGMVGGEERLKQLKTLGFEGVDRLNPHHVGGYDVVLDMAGGKTLTSILPHLNQDARVVTIGFMDGAETVIDMRHVLTHRLTLTGFALRPLPLEHKTLIANFIREKNLLSRLTPVVHAMYPKDKLNDALAAMRAGGIVGKLVLSFA